MYTPVNPCIKVGFKGVKIIQACFRDEYYMIALPYDTFNPFIPEFL